MSLYESNGSIYAVINGELYMRLEPLGKAEAGAEDAEQEAAGTTDVPPHKTRRPKSRLGDEAKAAIAEELETGAKVADLAEKYGVTTAAIYYIKKHGATPKRERGEGVKTFQCKKGHRFQTTLPQAKAICPTCREKPFRELTDNPVTDGSLLGKDAHA